MAEPSISHAQPPAVSVIIPCHNSAAVMTGQLTALTRQVSAPPFEVICVDNRSSDDLAAAVRAFDGQLSLRLVRADRLANPGYARNVGVGYARSDLLAFCDSDDHVGRWWVRDAAAGLTQAAIVNGNAVPVAAADFALGLEHLDQVLDAEAAAAVGQPGDVSVRSEVNWPSGASGLPEVIVPPAPLPYPILLGGCCAFLRQVYLDLGGYDGAMPYGIEDNDLALRAQAAGYLIGRSQGMRLAYRTRDERDQTARRAYLTGERHLLLAHRHQLFRRSPSLDAGWWLELPKAGVAAALMVVKPSSRDWTNLGRRAAQAAGALAGQVRHGWLRRRRAAQIGIGLDEGGR